MMRFVLVIVLSLGTAAFVAISIVQRRRAQRRARTELATRARLSDKVFLAGCGIEPDTEPASLALICREVIAKLGTVPVDSVRADDRFADELSKLPFWDSLDWLAVSFEIDRRAGGRVRIFDGVMEPVIREAGRNLTVRQLVIAITTGAARVDPK